MNMDNLDYKRVDPKAKNVIRVSSAIGSGLLIIACVIAAAILVVSDTVAKIILIIPALIAVLAIIDIIVVPEIRYRRYKYYLDDEMLVVEEGLWFITRSIAPIERIHQIEVKRGPVDRMFNMGNVIVTTAGGVVKIAFLEDAVADEIAARLNARINSIVKAQRGEV
ncbi:MAG: PH domain-containing protein [Clostridia bacterium]|nr:PH domain-containing protein [Clostridia bacterium]